MIAVSIIVPCFNAYSKIGRCLASLRAIDFPDGEYEVIFVDDKSNDGSYEILKGECEREKKWSVTQLQKNSGSPSKPRNEGVKLAKGEYIFYLDCDDEILPSTLKNYYNHATDNNACLVRGSLLADNGKRKLLMNTIPDWSSNLSKKERIIKIIEKQSTTPPQLVKKSLVISNEIKWPEKIKMGEDTLFLVELLCNAERIEYLDEPCYVYNKRPALTLSSTQAYGKRELQDHIFVWSESYEKLSKVGVDYFSVRLSVALQNALHSLIHRNKGDIDESVFNNFSKFIVKHNKTIRFFGLKERYLDIVDALLNNDFSLFKKLCRPRMVVAGHDLKFISPAEKALSEYFDIRYDKWNSHTEHDEKNSLNLIEWAEVIWCEWMLGNSLWYSNNKKKNQKLVVRMHRQELGTVYAEKIDFNNVDIVFTVSTLFFERVIERFPNIPRHKVRILPNYVDVDAYSKEWHDDRLFTLAMIGILPSKKNFHLALEILNSLKKEDSRYKLLVYGKMPEDLPWLRKSKEEMAYYDKCNSFIKKNSLRESVEFRGHCDIKKDLAGDRVGFVLSLSESVFDLPGFESFHLAVADGFASGGVSLIKRWAGCEYIFQSSVIFESTADIVSVIHEWSVEEEFKYISRKGVDFLKSHYSLFDFSDSIKSDVSSIL